MTPAEIGRELAYPLRHSAIVLALLFFWALSRLAGAAGMIGLPLALVLLPAWSRYLVNLLEGRAGGRTPAAPSIETFSFWSDTWALTPLIPASVVMLCVVWLVASGLVQAAVPLMIAAVMLLPASIGVLAITHSPAESLNPLAWSKLIRACGSAYLVVPVTLCCLGLLIVVAAASGMPRFLAEIGLDYLLILLFTLTGALLHAKDIADDVSIPEGLPLPPDELRERTLKERRTVANHAYGLVSRGNRAGGLAHVRQNLAREPDVGAAAQWYFNEMLRWESADAALAFGQDCLAHYLHEDDDARALKTIATCLHADPRWKPAATDRVHALELLRRHGRADLERLLANG